MTLARKCSNCFDANTRSKGQAYYSSGMVRHLEIRDDLIRGRVRGSQAADYEVELDLSDPSGRRIVGRCNCPHYQEGFLCKHLWAVILANDNNSEAVTSPRPSVEIQHEDDLEDGDAEDTTDHSDDPADDDDFEEVESPSLIKLLPPQMTSLLGVRSQSVSKPKAPVNWRKQLAAIASDVGDDSSSTKQGLGPAAKARQIWYLLNVAASQSKKNMLAVEFFQREQKKNGDWGKLKRCQIRPDSLQQFAPTEEDRRLIGALIGNEPDEHADSSYGYAYYGSHYYSYRGFNRSWVRPAIYEWLLPQLAATNRFVWSLDSSLPLEEAQHVVWDGETPWRCRLRLATDAEKQCWRVVGEFERGDEIAPFDSAVMILADGLVLFPDRLCRADIDRESAWVTALRTGVNVEIPFKDRVPLLKELCKLPQAPRFDLPAEVCAVKELGEPRPRVEISTPPQRYAYRETDLWAKLSFQYADQRFGWQDGSSASWDEAGNRLVLRDRKREQEFSARLSALGFQPPKSYFAREEADFTLSQKRLVDAVRVLNSENWIIETQGVRVRRPGEFKLDVTTSLDWFELHGTVDFDGVTASLPALLAALRNNEQFVRLDDGSQGILPEEWLEKYGRLAQLAETSGENLRFSTSQGLLLDALLAEQQGVELDQGFLDYREKLRSFGGVKAADPVEGFRGELRHYQKEGLGWLHFLREFRFGGCLADDMGLGKTVQVLALLEARRIRELESGEKRRPSLVVVPKSLVFNWIEEGVRFAPQLRMRNYTGIERGDGAANLDEYDVLLTTYGTLRRDIIKLKEIQFDYAILDEAQAIKNAASQAAKACRLIKADHRLAMSGTPVENHLGELWSLFDFLNPGMLGRSSAFASFARTHSDHDRDSLQLLSRAVRPFLLRRTKQQVLTELPEKMEQTLTCELSTTERKAYDELRDYYRVQLTNAVKTKGLAKAKIHVLEALLRLRQAACHPGLLDKQKIGEGSAKLEALLEQIEEVVAEGHKALVFSQFTSLLSIVRHHLDKQGIVYEYLDGQTRNRGERVKRFQEDLACPLFLISLKAGGHGLNLTAADYVFILDPWWNPAVEAQAVDRAHRIGQTRRVFAYRLIARGTVEDKILELQKSKKDLADAIVSANNSVIRSLTAEDLELLLS